MSVPAELDRRFRDAAAEEGLLEVAYDLVDTPIGALFVAGAGCAACQGSGIAGRTVVAEVLLPDAELMELLRRGDKAAAAALCRRRGSGSMLEHAVSKVCEGLCDPFQAEEEVGPLHLSDGPRPVEAVAEHGDSASPPPTLQLVAAAGGRALA